VVQSRSRIPSRLLSEGNIHAFFSHEEMASVLRIPLKTAKYLYKTGESAYLVFNRSSDLYLTWDGAIAPIYEERVVNDLAYFRPFRAAWPFFVKRTIRSGITFDKGPRSMGPDNKPLLPIVDQVPPVPKEASKKVTLKLDGSEDGKDPAKPDPLKEPKEDKNKKNKGSKGNSKDSKDE
jgi:hypothetical protein